MLQRDLSSFGTAYTARLRHLTDLFLRTSHQVSCKRSVALLIAWPSFSKRLAMPTGSARNFSSKHHMVFKSLDRRQAISVAGSSLLTASSLAGFSAARATSSLDSLASIWAKLESAAWIGDGSKSASHVVYVISDPNCVWCHRFWEASRPWVQDGKTQLRHLLVGIIRPDSARKAATILSAKDRAAALEQNERAFSKGGIFPSGAVTGEVQLELEKNLRLMRELEFNGTPALVYKNQSGKVTKVSGFPRDDQLRQVMGER